MIKVTDEMLDLMEDWASQDEVNKHSAINYVFNIIELHEQSKPKPEPVGYAWIKNNKVKMITDTELNSGFVPLYTTPPTREPLSDDEISKILFLCRKGKMFPYSFARDIEQAHGIGANNA